MADQLVELKDHIDTVLPDGARIVFVSGTFNVVHPGHLRLLNFAAECGDFLVVALNVDGGVDVHVPQDMRLEGIKAIGVVDHAFIIDRPLPDLLRELRPAVVVKGKEHESMENLEAAVVAEYGGKLLFVSGEVRFSSLDLLQKELREANLTTIIKPTDYPNRHGFAFNDLVCTVRRFGSLKAIVIGDLIVDEYINCEPLGMSREDPTIVVSPIRRDTFVGGAGIVAAHAAGLGARVSYLSVTGEDECASYVGNELTRMGVECCFVTDDSRPTTLKQRFRAQGKTLLRVSHLRQHDISQDISDALLRAVMEKLDGANLLIFSDFNYGCLPQHLVNAIGAECHRRGVMVVADSQSSSQVGDVSRFRNARLLTPTEHEARLAVRDQHGGLVVMADTLLKSANARELIVKLGAEGLLVHAPNSPNGDLITDRLPAFNAAPKDVSGAGDSLLTAAALTLALGETIWRAAYLGSLAAACQVGRVGNVPLNAQEVINELLL